MNILLIATESVPYSKTSVLGDIVFGLAKELRAQGHDSRIVIPCYRGSLDTSQPRLILARLAIPLGEYKREAQIWKSAGEPPIYLIGDDHDYYFERESLYGYLDDYERFIFFTRAAVSMLSDRSFRQAEGNWFPDILQGFDWAVGMIPGWMPGLRKQDRRFKNTRFVHSIHNIGRTGVFGSRALQVAGFKTMAGAEEALIYSILEEDAEHIQFLGRGILGAEKVVTVNPRFSARNPLPAMAQPLVKVLAQREDEADLVGIRSGIDPEEFDPISDRNIFKPFRESSLKDRLANKLALQKALGLPSGETVPLLGMVTRLVPEKGFDLFDDTLLRGLEALGPLQMVIQADPGDRRTIRTLDEWEKNAELSNSPVQIKIRYGFDDEWARKIYAASDLFLLPSREEPAAIQQYIAMRYGAIPVAHSTGVLAESIFPYQQGMDVRSYNRRSEGVGFLFDEFASAAFLDALDKAIHIYRSEPRLWQEIQRHNMRCDFSWYEPANQYTELYAKTLASPPQPQPKGGASLKLDDNARLLQALLEVDSLPGLFQRDPQELLKQSARFLRELVGCDAVYLWMLPEEAPLYSSNVVFQEMDLAAFSLARHGDSQRQEPDRLAVSELLNRDMPSNWVQSSGPVAGSMVQSIAGLAEANGLQTHGWVAGRSVPITAHSRIFGRIDVLFTRQLDDPKKNSWLNYVLISLANSFGFRMETIRRAQQSEQILETDQQLFAARSFGETVEATLAQARKLSLGAEAWLYILEGEALKPIGESIYLQPSPAEENNLQPAWIDAGLAWAREAARDQTVKYLRDWRKAADNRELISPFRSLIAVPLATDGETVGVLAVASQAPAGFSREIENALKDHLAPQAAIALKTSLWHEQREQSRDKQLLDMSSNLAKLSAALVGSLDMQTLLQNIVETTTSVLQVDAASLFLADDKGERLVIQAASGYQAPLVAARASYAWGEGVTGRIAQSNRPFMANSLEALRTEGRSPKGRYDDMQGGNRPQAFYGLPLNVAGQSRPIGVLKAERLSARPFTNEDVLLIEMMGNVIAAVVYNTQLDQVRLNDLIKSLGSLAQPKRNAVRLLLSSFARSSDLSLIRALGAALAASIGDDLERGYSEARLLLQENASPAVYEMVADATQNRVHLFFNNFAQALRSVAIVKDHLESVLEITYLWFRLQEARLGVAALRDFLQAWGKACLFAIKNVDSQGDWRRFLLDTERSFEGTYLPAELSVIFHLHGVPADDNDLIKLRSLSNMRSQREKPCVVLPLWGDRVLLENREALLKSKFQQIYAIDTVILSIHQIQAILGSNRPEIEFQRTILPHLSLISISPYRENGPVPTEIFFGRDREMAQIMDGLLRKASYAVIGGRRVGKSSVLLQLCNYRLPANGFRTLYFDGSIVRDLDSLCSARIRFTHEEDEPGLPQTFGELFDKPPRDKPLVICLDEADKLVDADQRPENKPWAIFKALRAFVNNGDGLFVFGGEYNLRKASQDASSPFYNLADIMLLGPLDKSAVEELVRGPMARLGIALVPETEITSNIFEFTSGHPNIVQKLCIRLIDQLTPEKGRQIHLQDVKAVIDDPHFQQNDFLLTLWERASDLEKILSLLLSQQDQPERAYSFEAIVTLVKTLALQATPLEVQTALANLVDLRLILKHTPKGYAFASPSFTRILGKSQAAQELLLVLCDQYRREQGKEKS